MKRLLTAGLIITTVAVGIFFSAQVSNADKIVAKLDGVEITKGDLSNHVDSILGEKYREMLDSDDGLKKLAGYYIDRKILADYARKNVDKKNKVLNNHAERGSLDEDTMYISALLEKEVNSKVEISEQEVSKLMLDKNIEEEAHAEQALRAQKRKELFARLIEEVRQGHEIVYN